MKLMLIDRLICTWKELNCNIKEQIIMLKSISVQKLLRVHTRYLGFVIKNDQNSKSISKVFK